MMTIKEYRNELAALEVENKKKKEQLGIKFAQVNNPVKVGDIVSDSDTTIRVRRISFYYSITNAVPACVYRGERLTKSMKLFKSDKKGTIYQSKILKHIVE